MPVTDREDMEEAARRIHALGPRYVLVKGGHLKGDATTCSGTAARSRAFSAARGSTRTTPTAPAARSRRPSPPGSRSAAPLAEAVREAKAYVTRAIREGFQAGRGVGQLRHFIGLVMVTT